MSRNPWRRHVALCLPLLAIAASTLLPHAANADPVPGFIEHWPGTSGGGFGGGSHYSNPGTGGELGAGDGFFIVSTLAVANLGTSSFSANYSGDWIAAGVGKVKFWLNDVGNPDPLEIHFSIGNDFNFWQYNPGFIPAPGTWTQFTVDLGSTDFTHIINSNGGTFSDALHAVDRILIRHDLAPYVKTPDQIQADFGLDELELVSSGSTGVPLPGVSVAMPVELAPPYPNPSRGPVALSLLSHDASEIHLDVLDVTGRVVRHATLAAASPGPRLWTWDGRTDRGEVAPAGYYRVRAYSAAGGTSQPLVRLGAAR